MNSIIFRLYFKKDFIRMWVFRQFSIRRNWMYEYIKYEIYIIHLSNIMNIMHVLHNNNNNNNETEKKNKTRDKSLDLARKLKKPWNMKVTVIPIMIGAHGTVTKRLVQGLVDLEIRKRVLTIQITALLRSARILRRVLKSWGNFLSLKLQWECSSGVMVKALDCRIVVSGFERLHSLANKYKGMNPLLLPAMG